MTTPALEAIWTNLLAAVRAIDGTGSYHYTVDADAVYADMVNLLTVPKAPAVILGPSDGTAREFKAGMRVRDRLVFSLEARVDADGQGAMAKAEAFARFAADLERALTRDLTRGGLAARTLVRPPIGPFMGFGAQTAVLFTQEVEVDLVRTYGAS